MQDPTTPKDLLLYMFSEAKEWKEDVDGDTDSSGRTQMFITHHIVLGGHLLDELCEMAGLKKDYDESWFQALARLSKD